MSVAVEFRNVTKEFGPVRVLHGVGFALQPGRVYGLLGEIFRLYQCLSPFALGSPCYSLHHQHRKAGCLKPALLKWFPNASLHFICLADSLASFS